MKENETISVIAIVLSLLAFFSCIGIGCYMYFDKPVEFDISGINENALLITSLQNDVSGVKGDINLLLDMYQGKVTENDLDRVKNDIKDVERDIRRIKGCVEDYYDCVEDEDCEDDNYDVFVECMINKFD